LGLLGYAEGGTCRTGLLRRTMIITSKSTWVNSATQNNINMNNNTIGFRT
jgi:hypothetical protein